MAQAFVETENIEFFVLVQRLQNINNRLEKDTEKLVALKAEEDIRIGSEEEGMLAMRNKQLTRRRSATAHKEDWQAQKEAAFKTHED